MTSYKEDVTPTVLEIEKISITGNVVPPSWYQAIKTKSGKTALLAINILADVVYWYRPTVIRDEETGAIISKSKKFKSDKLQRQYSQIVDFLGCSKEQAKEAVDLLVDLGLITREFRTVKTGTMILNNVMFLEPIPPRIEEITYRPSPTFLPPPIGENGDQVGDKRGGTNTDINSKTSPKTSNKGRAKTARQPSNKIPDRFPAKFESLANTFIRETGLKCESKSDYDFWCWGNKKSRQRGFESYVLNGITSNDIIQAVKAIRLNNKKSPNNPIVIGAPSSLFHFAFTAKQIRSSSQQARQESEADQELVDILNGANHAQ